MIELEISQEHLLMHESLFFGNNKKKKKRLYRKLEAIVQSEKQIVIKRIFKWIFDNIEHIILGDIEVLSLAKAEFNIYIKQLSKIDLQYLFSKLGIFLDEYDYFIKASEWNAYKFQRELGITVCPYCNTQFVFVYEHEEAGRTRATLDHFYDKATYPFLAVSIYNLVPSCKVCNSDLKNTKKTDISTHYSPYEKSILENLKIKRQVGNMFNKSESDEVDYVGSILGVNEDFDIIFDYPKDNSIVSNKIKGNIELFHLDKIYNHFHKTYVQDIIKKSIIYNEAYLNQLKFSNTIIFNNEEHLRNSLFMPKENDKVNILGKLTRDIIESEITYRYNK